MRLDKYLSSVTELSRMQSKRIIKAGKVCVAGEPIRDPRVDVLPQAKVELEGQLLRSATNRYFMMNKPINCVCATKDRQHMTAIDLMDEDNQDQLHIAGRLDLDSTGLLLITDDGIWSHRITSPNNDCKKTYYVETLEPIDPCAVAIFKQGIKLANEMRATRSAELEITDTHIAQVTISEGKYHQIKRMFASVGNKVDVLHRQRIGRIDLDTTLKPGEYRSLTTDEVACV
jgi:16S rRNA pseudouridine516 synthase